MNDATNNSKPSIARVTVTGRTEWSSTTWKTVYRFRGSRQQEVKVRDKKGKPAMSARYLVNIWIVCADGVSYQFTHDLDMNGEVGCYMHVHGMRVPLSSYNLPVNVSAAHKRARLRVKACLRIMQRDVASMPRFRALPKAAA